MTTFNVAGPIYDSATQKERLFCLACDDEMAAVQQLFPDGVQPGECVAEQLQGEVLSFNNGGVRSECDCFQTDPYPPAEFPAMSNKNRRYFYYRSVAPLLGATGRRVQLPCCVTEKIEEQHPIETEEPATGFRA